MPSRSMHRYVSILVAGALTLGVGVSSIAAEGEEPQQQQTRPQVRNEPGSALKIGGVKVTDSWLVVSDARNDFVREDGSSVDVTNAKADIVEAWIASGVVDKRLLKAINGGKLQYGKPGNWRGADFDSKKSDAVLVVALKTARKATVKSARDQQVVVTFDGDDAFANRPGPDAGVYTGSETISIGGGFGKDGWLSGDSSLKQLVPGEAVALFNAKSRGVGGVDKASGSMVHIVPAPPDAQTISVMMRIDAGNLYDLVQMPGGGTRMGLPDKPWGFNVAANVTDEYPADSVLPYFCSNISTSGSGALDATFGFNRPRTDVDYDSIVLRLYPAGSDESYTVFDARLESEFGGYVGKLTADIPEGQWNPDMFGLWDDGSLPDDPLLAPKFSPHLGSAGMLVAEGLVGLVAGDEECGRWQLPATACDLIDAEAIAAAMGIEGEVDKADGTGPDGSLLCAAFLVGGSDPYSVASIGREYYAQEDLERDVAQYGCPSRKAPLGAAGFRVDCTEEGFESYLWRVLPVELEALDPNGGLLVAVDINTMFAGASGEIDFLGIDLALQGLSDAVAEDAFRYPLRLAGYF